MDLSVSFLCIYKHRLVPTSSWRRTVATVYNTMAMPQKLKCSNLAKFTSSDNLPCRNFNKALKFGGSNLASFPGSLLCPREESLGTKLK